MSGTKNSIVGKEVYDKRSGLMGRVVKEDGLSLVIKFSVEGKEDVMKTITPATFKRWYRVIEDSEEEAAPETAAPVDEVPAEEASTEESVADETEEEKTPVGTGSQLCTLFLNTCKEVANQDLEIKTTKDPRQVVVKYNGRNVFEMTLCKRRLVVMCHPKSLTAENMKRVDKLYPKEFGWPLSAKFVFTEEGQLPLMKSVITDGLYYRQIVEKEEETK